jgi:hypothetical protein
MAKLRVVIDLDRETGAVGIKGDEGLNHGDIFFMMESAKHIIIHSLGMVPAVEETPKGIAIPKDMVPAAKVEIIHAKTE